MAQRKAKTNSADRLFQVSMTETRTLLKRVDDLMSAYAARQLHDKQNYGFAGTVDYVNDQLAYILAALGDRSIVDAKELEY